MIVRLFVTLTVQLVKVPRNANEPLRGAMEGHLVHSPLSLFSAGDLLVDFCVMRFDLTPCLCNLRRRSRGIGDYRALCFRRWAEMNTGSLSTLLHRSFATHDRLRLRLAEGSAKRSIVARTFAAEFATRRCRMVRCWCRRSRMVRC